MAIKASSNITLVRVDDGPTGPAGNNAITGDLSLHPIILPANASGVVSNYTNAKGTFKVFDGTTEVSGVTYSLVSATGVTASINSTTGAYVVSSMPNTTDFGTAMFKAVYKNTTIEKILAVIKAKQGTTGKGISKTAVTYQPGTSGTTAPTGTWSTSIPSVAANQYLWTRTITTYTDSTTTTAYSVGKMGANGATGATGATGAAGKGISKTAVTYQASGSGTTTPTGTWSTAIPSVSAGQYLWSRTVTTYTDNTTSTAYSVGKMGNNGTSGIIPSATAPNNPTSGQLWQDTTNNVIKKWNGSEWIMWFLDVSNLNVDNLSAITSTLGRVVNPYTTNLEGETLKGEITIADSVIKNEFDIGNGWQTGRWEITPLTNKMQINYTTGEMFAGAELSAKSLKFYDIEEEAWRDIKEIIMYEVLNTIYPVGSTYMSTSPTPPEQLFVGSWTWERIAQGRAIFGVNENDASFKTPEQIGGSKTVNLNHKHLQTMGVGENLFYFRTNNPFYSETTTAPMANWGISSKQTNIGRYDYTDSALSSQHSMLPPYYTLYMWKRVS